MGSALENCQQSVVEKIDKVRGKIGHKATAAKFIKQLEDREKRKTYTCHDEWE